MKTHRQHTERKLAHDPLAVAFVGQYGKASWEKQPIPAEPAPNKAQHSPLPDAKRPWQNDPVTITWKSGGITDEERIANLQFSLRNEVNAHVKVIKERDALRNHVGKLAECLRGVQWKITAFGSHWEPSQAEREAIAATLAAYEAAQ